MKILFNANRFPYPPFRGDKLKIYHLAKRLAKKHELHLLTFLQDKDDLQYLPELKKIFKEIYLVPLPHAQSLVQSALGLFRPTPVQVSFFSSAAMSRKIEALLQEQVYDLVHVQHIRMAQYWQHRPTIPRILDLPDAYSLYWKRGIAIKSGIRKIFAKLEYHRLLRYEQVLHDFDLSLVCSTEDQEYLQQHIGIPRVGLLPNGVDLDTFSNPEHDYRQQHKLLFTGNMDYAPNVDAVCYFTKEILPVIREQLPDTQFIIAGQRPVKKVLDLASDHITVTGFVKDLATLYRQAAVVVAPLRFGAGTQNKVLEAMAMGVPVVSHSIGFKGLDIASGAGAYQELSATDFARRCVELLGSEPLRRATGRQGQQVIRRRFDWEVIAAQLEQYCDQLINKRATTGPLPHTE